MRVSLHFEVFLLNVVVPGHRPDLDDPILAAMDDLTEVVPLLPLQALAQELLKRVNGVVHLLPRETGRAKKI